MSTILVLVTPTRRPHLDYQHAAASLPSDSYFALKWHDALLNSAMSSNQLNVYRRKHNCHNFNCTEWKNVPLWPLYEMFYFERVEMTVFFCIDDFRMILNADFYFLPPSVFNIQFWCNHFGFLSNEVSENYFLILKARCGGWTDWTSLKGHISFQNIDQWLSGSTKCK